MTLLDGRLARVAAIVFGLLFLSLGFTAQQTGASPVDPATAAEQGDDHAMEDAVDQVVGQSVNDGEDAGDANTDEAADAWVAKIMGDSGVASDVLEKDNADSTPVILEGKGPASLYTGTALIKHDDPFVDSSCRRDALMAGLKTLREHKGLTSPQAIKAAETHMREHLKMAQSGKVSQADYLNHLGECKDFCGPVVAAMIQCHVESVAETHPQAIFFKIGSDQIGDQASIANIREAGQRLQDNPKARILLVGRASRIGSVSYNKALSGRRVFAVRDALLDQGVGESRIHNIWLGFEPPYLDANMARRYGLADAYLLRGQTGANQSVLLVVYDGEEASAKNTPDGDNATTSLRLEDNRAVGRVKAIIDEQLRVADALKVVVAEYFSNRGHLPDPIDVVGWYDPGCCRGEFIDKISVEPKGVVEIRLQNLPGLGSGILWLVPSTGNGASISFECESDIAKIYLPKGCETHTTTLRADAASTHSERTREFPRRERVAV